MGYVRRKSPCTGGPQPGQFPGLSGDSALVLWEAGCCEGLPSWSRQLAFSPAGFGLFCADESGRVFWVPLVSTVHRLFSFLCVSAF